MTGTRTNARIDRCTERFMERLMPQESVYSEKYRCVESLVRAAFLTYHHEWQFPRGPESRFLITQWQWPFDQLASGEGFDGHEPWSVLFRTAIQHAQA